MKRCIICISLILFAAAADASAADMALTLKEALSISGRRSPGVLMASERLRQALARLNQARAIFLPHLDGTVNESRQVQDLDTTGIKTVISTPQGSPAMPSLTSAYNVFDARLKLTQLIFDPAAMKRLDAAAAGKDQSLAEERRTRNDAMAFAGSLFIEAQRSRETCSLSNKVLKLDYERYRIARSRFKEGAGSLTEVDRARSALALGRYSRQAAIASASQAEGDLRAVLALPENVSLVLVDDTAEYGEETAPRAGFSETLKQHPEILSAAAGLHQRRQEECAAWADFFPKISGSGNYGMTGNSPSETQNTYFYGVGLTVPLFAGGERFAKAAEAKSRSREAGIHLEDVVRTKGEKASQAADQLVSARLLVKAREEGRIQLKHQLDIYNVRFVSGSASRIDLIEVQTNMARSEDEYREALALYRTARLNFAHALGVMEKLLEKGIN